jgi:eukaryotic-like serine/threonine-protein kinase
MSTFDRDQWLALAPYLEQAFEMSDEERATWLASLRVQDSVLAEQLESLVNEHLSLAKSGFMDEASTVSLASGGGSGLTGQMIGPYRLISQIGEGGMGSVWLAERNDGRFERQVAVKFLHGALVGRGNEGRFKREGDILGRLSHPHIAELVDAGVSDAGIPYLVLEYVQGEHIDRYCDEHKLDVTARIRLLIDVADAVSHAHSNLIVHRDLKPSNVLVSKDGQVKLLDFGIAKLLEGQGQDGAATLLTIQAGRAMTPEYAAPEQITGAPVTTGTDVYSLGVLIYVLLTGQHPAGTATRSPAELVKAIVDIEPRRLSEVVTSSNLKSASGSDERSIAGHAAQRTTTPEKLRGLLRGDLDTIVAKALKKNPNERYSSVAALADDLGRYLKHEPISARPDTFRYRASKFVVRNRTAVMLTALIVLAAAAGVVGTLVQARRARQERDFAFRQLKRSQEHDDFLNFLLADAAPSGKPFSVSDLLALAEQVVEKQHSEDPARRADLLMWIGSDYSSEDQAAKARLLVEKAYQLSRGVSDPSIRARASCALAFCLAQADDLPRSETLVEEGLRDLPDDPRYAMDRVGCLRAGSEASREAGRTREGVVRIQEAQRIVQESPLATDILKLNTATDLASAYSDAGKDSEALSAFQEAASFLTSLGWQQTLTSIQLFNNWALELDQIGRPLEAEEIEHRAIDIARDGDSEDAVIPIVLTNYARILRKLNRLDEASDYAQRSYEKAQKAQNQMVMGQSMLERARIATGQHKFTEASALLSEVEPMMRKHLPPTHYAFANLAADRSAIAMGEGDTALALKQINEAVEIGEAGLKANGAGAFAFPGFLTRRSTIELAAGNMEQSVADANRALSLLLSKAEPGSFNNKIGYAYLALARALDAQGKHDEARTAAKSAFEHLEKSVGADHPETRSARQLAGIDPPSR